MKDNKHVGTVHVIHNTVEQVNRVGALGWRCNNVFLSKCIFSRQHATEVHALLPILVGPGVGVLCRVTRLDGKVCAVAVASS